MLVELVTRDGPAQWADKARQLGSGRSDFSVRSQWVDGLRYSEAGRAAEGLAADRELLQPTQQQSSGAGSLVSRGPPRVLVIAGPTGVGKSALAEQLCRSLGRAAPRTAARSSRPTRSRFTGGLTSARRSRPPPSNARRATTSSTSPTRR